MGQVYQATDTKLNRQVALKVLPESLRHDPQACRRFEREARSAAALDHPFICKIYEVLDADGDSCIAMEYVVGETVQARLERGALTPQEALLISKEVAEALEEAHRHQIVHRDIKPANIMLTSHGHVKVMDFGLAKRFSGDDSSDTVISDRLTATNTWVGTPA